MNLPDSRQASEKHALLFVEKNAEILEMIAKGKPAAEIYNAIALMYEARHPGMRCSMLELNDGKLMHGGAPSLPKEYCDAVHGLKNGPDVGSCGASTFTGKRVLVENIATDPKWVDIKDAALPHGMRCCWSEPIKNSCGKVLGAFGMYYDYPALPTEDELSDLVSAARLAGIIMERDQREAELRQSEYKYRTLVENLPQRFFLKDKHSRFISCSNNFADDLNTTAEEIAGTNDFHYYTDELARKYQQEDQSIMQSGTSGEFIETILVDGIEKISQTVKTPILDGDGNIDGVLGISWDITEQTLMEEKYRQAQKMESVGTLVGGVAHEFNNTLAGIMGRLFLANSDAKDNPNVLRHLDIMSKLSERAADVVKQLLTFSRKSPIQYKAFDLSGFVKDTYKLNKLSIPENIKLVLRVSQQPLPILGDEAQVQQILINLLNNARDAVSGVEQPEIELSLSMTDPDTVVPGSKQNTTGQNFAYLRVSDNGCGISEDNMKKIFDPFFTTKEVGKGTGLGLAMVFGAVQMHKGVIDVQSMPGKGTSMNIYFPLTQQESQLARDGHAELEEGAGECILFVDDEPALRELGSEILETLGYSVLIASNGVEAIKTYQSNRESIQAVVMDVVMPEMGGVDAARAMKEVNPNVKVIFCTGYDGKDVIDNSILQWAQVINKPYSIDSLNQVIKQALYP